MMRVRAANEKKEKTERKSSFEKCYRILEYLRENTNEEHRLSQKDLREKGKLDEYIVDKGSFNDYINAMAETLNYSKSGIKEEKDWQLVFDASVREFGDDHLDDDTELPWHIENDDGILPRRPVKNIYYNPVFSYEEINQIEEGILFSKGYQYEKGKRTDCKD